jgi:cation:H+ antiporter
MLEDLPLVALAAIFLVGAGVVWAAGTKLTDATDALSARLHLGEALGGLILLAIATNLPEIAIAVAAGLSGNLEIVTGNILGGIAIQTVVLVVLDVVAGQKSGRPLTNRAASLVLAIEGLLVLALLSVVVMGAQLPGSVELARIRPGPLVIVTLWLIGLWLVDHARDGLPWADDEADKRGIDRDAGQAKVDMSIKRAATVFGVAAGLTLLAGVALEQSSEAIAAQLGLSNVVFGATVLAAATALPEVSTGISSVRLGDSQLAVSDILGGNAFLPTLFFVASVISGQAVLSGAKPADLYLTGLAGLLTVVVVIGLVFRPRKQILRMGIDSLAILALYVIGIGGLLLVASAG